MMKNAYAGWRGLSVGMMLLGGMQAWGDAAAVRFISHRGESLDAPENTMAAYRSAVKRGADGCECDIYLTKDNGIVCLHDSTAKRTAGKNVKPCDATLAELRALDAGAWKGPQFRGERLPTLAELLSLAHDGFEIYVEVKCGTEILPKLAEVMAAEPKATPDRVLFICFKTNVVAALRQQFPAYRTYWLTGTKRNVDGSVVPTAASAVATAKACRASGIDAQASAALSAEYVREVKAAGLSFHVWTVDDARKASELAAMGVDTITSNCGAELAALARTRMDGRPIVHWTFDGTATNSGCGDAVFDARLSGSPAYTNGIDGRGLALDGTNGVASVVYPFSERGAITLWYRPAAFYNFNTVFDNDRNPDQWEMWVDGRGVLRFRMGKNSGDMTCNLTRLGGPEQWYHIALSWDNVSTNQVKLYVNGAERDPAPIGRWVAPGGVFYFGGGNPKNTKGRGAVDDVRIYASPLSALQVGELFGVKGPGSAIGVWPRLEANLHAAADVRAVSLRRGQRLVLDAAQAALAPAINQTGVVSVTESSVAIPAEGLITFAVDAEEPLYVTGELELEPDADLRPGLRATVLSDDTLVGAPMVKAAPWYNVGKSEIGPAPAVSGTKPDAKVKLTEWRLEKGRHTLTVAGPHMRPAGRFIRLELQTLARLPEKPLYAFAVFADTHLGDGRMKWMNVKMDGPAIAELGESLKQLRGEGVSFAFIAGDMTDYGTRPQIEALARTIKGAGLSVYGCIGNHEVFTAGSRTNLTALVPGLFPEGKTQYALAKPPLRFVVLDGSWWRDRDGNALDAYDKTKAVRMTPKPAELDWLRQTLAADTRTPTLVMWHYPFYSGRGETSCGYRLGKPMIWSPEVMPILEAATNVVATLNGHMHYNAVDAYRGIVCLQNAAYAEWPHLYRVLRVYSDRIEWEVRQVHNRGFVSEGVLPEKALTWMISTREGDLAGMVRLAPVKR
jgi:glycerophosphoryl diester phosphodiesterase